jgi:hypothetical protein
VTLYRKDPNKITNYFEPLMRGCGPRERATFTDVDACTHDRDTDRFLFQEFKQPWEVLNRGGVSPCLAALARKDYVTVWCVRKLGDGLQGNGRVEWCDVASRQHGVITTDEYREFVRRWWYQRPIILRDILDARRHRRDDDDPPSPPLTAADIPWSHR